jgi:hypothetical protein
VKQVHTQIIFDLTHPPAQRGLRDMQISCSLVDAAQGRDLNEIAQLLVVDGHAQTLYPMGITTQ